MARAGPLIGQLWLVQPSDWLGAIRYFLIIDTYLETITDKGWAEIMTRIKVMQAASPADWRSRAHYFRTVRDVKIIRSEYSWTR